MSCVEPKPHLKRRSIPPPLDLTAITMATGGVHITDFGSTDVNPQPVQVEETDTLLEEYLSPTKLKAIAGVDNLEAVTFLELRVDSSETSLGNFGMMLPNLKQLKLNNSIITTARDLGTCLENLRVLWMARCCLCDIDGISSMSSLQELYLAYNSISDISPCSMLENLCLLDLEGNNIEDVTQIEFLRLCGKLKTLTLEGNPVCLAPRPDYDKDVDGPFDYRGSVREAIPQLEILDDELMSTAPSSLGSEVMNLSTDWLLVNDAIKEAMSSSEVIDESGRPTTARPGSASRRRPGSSGGRPGSSGGRPGSSLAGRPGSSSGVRPGSSLGHRPGTAVRPGTADPGHYSGGSDEEDDDTSALTHGNVICGNPVRGLRARRSKHKTPPQAAPSIFSLMHFKPEHSYIEEEDEGKSKEDLFEELRKWKLDHEKIVSVRLKASEPQILRITHDDQESSDEEEGQQYEDTDINRNSYQGYFRRKTSLSSREDEDTGIEMTPPSTGSSRMTPPSTGSSDYRARSSPEEGERIPTPPKALKPAARPRTAGDFRARRRFIRSSSLEGVQGMEQPEVRSIENGPTIDDHDPRSLSPIHQSLPSPLPLATIDERPFSGPVQGNRKYKAGPFHDSNANSIDRHEPVIRTATQTPPNLAKRLSASLARPSTAGAALQRCMLPNKTPRSNISM